MRKRKIPRSLILRAVGISVLAVVLAPAWAATQPILWPNVKTNSNHAEVYLGRKLWLRLRSANASEEAKALVDTLTEALLAAPTAADVKTRRGDAGAWQLLVGDSVIATVTREEAAAQKSSPEGLTGLWARKLKRDLHASYVAVWASATVDVPVGEGRLVRLAGPGLAKLSATVDPDTVAQLRDMGPKLWVSGVDSGDARLKLSTDDDRVSVPVRVRWWAATIPPTITATVTAPLKPDEWAEMAKAALACAVTGRPRSQVNADLTGVAWPDFTARVTAAAPNCFPARAQTTVEAKVSPQDFAEPREVWVSNYPEKVDCARTLLRDEIVSAPRAIRLLWHHVNVSNETLWFGVRICNYGKTRARFAWSAAACGPGKDEVYIGHTAAAGYLDMYLRKAAILLDLAPGSSVELEDIKTPPGLIASGVASFALQQGGPIVIEVLAHRRPPACCAELLPAGAKVPRRQTHLNFPGVLEKTGEFKVGGPWTFLRLGRGSGNNGHGRRLMGNYGVLYWLRLTLDNPTSTPADVELACEGAAGAARACFLIDGKLIETSLLTPGRDAVVYQWRVGAGESKDVLIATMPQSGSNYPVNLILRTPPGRR